MAPWMSAEAFEGLLKSLPSKFSSNARLATAERHESLEAASAESGTRDGDGDAINP